MAGREGSWVGCVRYGAPGLALGLALAWGAGARGPQVRAQGAAGGGVPLPAPAAERERARAAAEASANAAGGTIALTATAANGVQFLYLIDTRARSFAVYRVDPANPKGSVKLEAARQYQWDLKLDEYNNQEPKPAAVESVVRSAGSPAR